MFAFAPLTRLRDWLNTDQVLREFAKHRGSRLGLAAIDVARGEIASGARERGRNNAGSDVARYKAGHGGKGAWCAAFTYYCLLTAASNLKSALTVTRTHGARKLFGRIAKDGMLVQLQEIQPGDAVLWARGSQGSWQANIGLVSRVERCGGKVARWWYIAGNEGPYPARVGEFEGTDKKRRVGFARMGW